MEVFEVTGPVFPGPTNIRRKWGESKLRWLRRLSAQGDQDCPFSGAMLGSEEVDSVYDNPVKCGPAGRAVAWLQSAAAEVWIKFLLALLGLGLAFGAALFSTASGEAGNLWAAGIIARDPPIT